MTDLVSLKGRRAQANTQNHQTNHQNDRFCVFKGAPRPRREHARKKRTPEKEPKLRSAKILANQAFKKFKFIMYLIRKSVCDIKWALMGLNWASFLNLGQAALKLQGAFKLWTDLLLNAALCWVSLSFACFVAFWAPCQREIDRNTCRKHLPGRFAIEIW